MTLKIQASSSKAGVKKGLCKIKWFLWEHTHGNTHTHTYVHTHLSSHFELDQPADRTVSIYSVDQHWVAV